MQRALEPTADHGWVLREHRYDLLRESSIESRFAISNGFVGVRGARAVSRGPTWASRMQTINWASSPRTYVAGLFETPDADPPVPALVPVPDWLRIRIHLNGKPLLLRAGSVLSHGRTLDMRRGALLSDWHHETADGVVIRLLTRRLVSLAERPIGLQLLQIELEQAQVDVTLEASFDMAGLGLDAVQLEDDFGVWRTESSDKGLAMAGAAVLRLDGRELPPQRLNHLKWSWRWRSNPGQVVSFERLVAVIRSDDPREDPGPAAVDALGRAQRLGWRGVLDTHEAAWADRWRCSDIEIEGDSEAQLAMRFASYHLNSAANPADERVSIGARALTGDAYLGHVFWDTEIYLLPFYTLTWPEAARALLMYRYHTLSGARRKAARMGWRGAMYAWESADTGDETTPEQVFAQDGTLVQVLCGTQEQHISADVAYAVWQYWHATQDEGFLLDAGAEILLETARFWASRAQPEPDGRHHIRGIIGPDEYHEHVDDNVYTNLMASWNIRRALEVVALLRDRWPERWANLADRLVLGDAELAYWHDAAETLVTNFDPRTGLFEQFAGYFGLEEIDLAEYEGRTAPMDVVLGRERTQRSQVIKQADVVALLALLPDAFDQRGKSANFRYYERRCGHGSSLSRAMHGLVAARLGDVELALRYFREMAAIDMTTNVAGGAGGVHIAGLGGLWQVAMLGFAGVSMQDDALAVDPHLPDGWRSLGFGVQWRGRRLRLRIEQTGGRLTATLEYGDPMRLVVAGTPHDLRPDEEVRTIWTPAR
jgi:trehalose/maltose hydrolase-like predicted phosphorylase